jgi:hypothetical protein
MLVSTLGNPPRFYASFEHRSDRLFRATKGTGNQVHIERLAFTGSVNHGMYALEIIVLLSPSTFPLAQYVLNRLRRSLVPTNPPRPIIVCDVLHVRRVSISIHPPQPLPAFDRPQFENTIRPDRPDRHC